MSLSSDNTVLTMPVQPAYQGYGSGFGSGFGWGGDFGSWIILFLLFGMFGGWGNNGYGWGNTGSYGGGFNAPGTQGFATRSDINEGFALNGLQNGQTSIKDAVTNGFHGVDTAVCQLGYNTQQGFNTLASQLSDCCCTTQRAIDSVRYDMATQAAATQNTIQNTTRDIIDNANANSRAILQALNDNYVRQLENENQSLKLAASQADQTAALRATMDANVAELLRRTGHDCPTPAYVVQPPTPVSFPSYCGCNSGCGVAV